MTFYYTFCYIVFAYSIAILLSYLFLVVQSYRAQKKMKIDMPSDTTLKYLMEAHPLPRGCQSSRQPTMRR